MECMAIDELGEASKHEDGPWGNVVDDAYLLLLRRFRKCLDGELSVRMLVERC